MEGGELLARRHKFRGRDIDPHVLQPLRRCLFGCGAMVFPEEGGICCASGAHILGPDFNPPMDARYLSLLQQPFMGSDSRVLNSALAMGTQQVFRYDCMCEVTSSLWQAGINGNSRRLRV